MAANIFWDHTVLVCLPLTIKYFYLTVYLSLSLSTTFFLHHPVQHNVYSIFVPEMLLILCKNIQI
jgi:hypothetical protein